MVKFCNCAEDLHAIIPPLRWNAQSASDSEEQGQKEKKEEEKAALTAFLHKLTDPGALTVERWSDPFVR
jgi:hypothetical protein